MSSVGILQQKEGYALELWYCIILRCMCLAVGYLLGSFLTADAVARCTAGIPMREIGSGNPGAFNALQSLGVPAGILVLAGDCLKTVLACLLCYFVGAPELGHLGMQYAGLGTTLGHNWPLRKVRYGGKGVAVTCTWLALALPGTGILCCAAGATFVFWTGYLPLGAIVIPLIAIPIAGIQFGTESAGIVAVAAAIMVLRHHRGLARIARGTEPKYFRRHRR